MAGKSKSSGKTSGEAAAPGFDLAQVRAIADALPNPIAYIDTHQRYLFVNAAFAEFFERPRSEILGRTVVELLGEDIYAVRKLMFDAAYAGERQWFAAG
jgi:PAS domain S-box-containing protein